MFDRRSEYSLNKKDKEAIVYTDAYGRVIRLTADDFGSTKEFRKWKNWTQMSSHSVEKKNHRYADHTLSFERMTFSLMDHPSVEEDYLIKMQSGERERLHDLLMDGIMSCLTEVQRRRFLRYYADGLTFRQIAAEENTSHMAIYDSIVSSREKLRKFMKNRLNKKAFFPR